MRILSRLGTNLRTSILLRVLPKQQNVYKTPQFIQRKTISTRFIRQETANSLKIKDNIPDQYELIYRCKMGKYFLWAQIISTAFVGIMVVAIIAIQTPQNFTMNFDEWHKKPGHVDNEQIVYFGVIIAICALVQLIIMKMPVRLYYYKKGKDYIMVHYGNLPNTIKKASFKKSDITKVPENGILPWKDSWYNIQNKGKVVFLENSFRTPADQSIMLGYQNDDDEDD